MYSKLEGSNAKCLNDLPEPLILRPPVGSENRGNWFLRFRNFVHPPSSQRRLFCISVLALFLTLLAILAGLFAWALFASDGLISWFHRQHAVPSCQLDVPRLKLRLTQMITTENDPTQDVFNVTLLSNRLTQGQPQQQEIHTLHLCSDALTIIRTHDSCYVRPMDAEWQRTCVQGYGIQLRNGGGDLRKTAVPRLVNEIWFLHPIWSAIKLAHNPYILSFCSNVPSFQMVSSSPADQYVIDPMETTESEDLLEDDAGLMALLDPAPMSDARHQMRSGYRDDVVRRARRSLTSEHQKPIHCRKVGHLFESSPIPSVSEDKEVTLTKEDLIVCPVNEDGSLWN